MRSTLEAAMGITMEEVILMVTGETTTEDLGKIPTSTTIVSVLQVQATAAPQCIRAGAINRPS